MKSVVMFAGAGVVALLVAGCTPQLDQTGLSPEEQKWAESIKANYGAWEVPESVPRGVKRDDINTDAGDSAASAEIPAATDAPAATPVAPVAPIAPEAVPEEAPAANAAAAAAAVPAPVAADNAAPETYTVVKGDTLGGIARKFYGRASQWTRIQEANKDLLKGKTVIRPGMKLAIPRP